MTPKIFIVTVILLIFGILASGLFFLVRYSGKSNQLVKALSWRIGLSFALFLFLFVAFYFHWITPHSLVG